MKIYIVSFLLAVSYLLWILTIDFYMGTPISKVFVKMGKPFQVVDPVEYLVSFIFLIIVLLKPIRYLIKKTIGRKSSTQ